MKAIALGTLILAGIGCTNIQPVGPLAHKMGHHAPAADKPSDVPEPVTVSAPKPVPPAMMVIPGEVSVDTAAASTQKLTSEFEYDWKTMPAPSKTAEISRIKGGIK